jgi:hypothetical protein
LRKEAGEFPAVLLAADTAHGAYVRSLRQQGIDFGPAACLVQERDQQLTYLGAGFLLSRP